MSWWSTMSESIKRGIRSWLNIQEATGTTINIRELLDYEGNAIRNRIWYRGDSFELTQLYEQIAEGSDRYKFWASKSSGGMEMRRIHTGLPALIINMLTSVALNDMDIQVSGGYEDLWEEIDRDNSFRKQLERAVKETLYIGDGAFKLSFDPELSRYPIIEYYPGDRIELEVKRGRIREVIFKTEYDHKGTGYLLKEHYGPGYITYELFRGNTEVALTAIPQTSSLTDWAFGDPDDPYMLAVPIRFYESGKWEERGQSVFDKKIDAFDAFDEAWSQWMDALRAGRATKYIPENLIPRDPETGAMMRPNPFDNRFVQTASDMSENGQNKITVEQPAIPTESYVQTYITALDNCLQGLISPSTLGIDVKKMDNAEAQREKEKATLYTRDDIIDALQVDIPKLVETCIRAYSDYYMASPAADFEVTVEFGDYANPSFESTVETIARARQAGVMSLEASVDELYGDDKDETWKREEVARLKAELGITDVEEPSVNLELGEFRADVEE